jgi:hypothetical protein
MEFCENSATDLARPMKIDIFGWVRTDIDRYVVLMFVIFCSLSCAGTAIAALRDESGMVVSADSLLVDPLTGRSTVCKIIPSGSGFFAVAGVAQSSNQYRTFDALKIAAQVGKETTVKTRADAFRRAALPSFRNAVNDIRRYAPNFFSQEIIGKPQALQAIFFGIEGGIATFQVETFSVTLVKGDIVIKPARIACPGVCTESINLQILGENDAAKAASRLIKDGGIINPHNLVESSRQLINIEERAVPDYVGGSIVSVIVRRSGPAAWIDPSHICDSQKHLRSSSSFRDRR